jgi:hypothetical protein
MIVNIHPSLYKGRASLLKGILFFEANKTIFLLQVNLNPRDILNWKIMVLICVNEIFLFMHLSIFSM